MEARRYQTLLHDPATFKAVDKLSFVELYNYEDESLNEYRQGELAEKDVDQWLAEMPPRAAETTRTGTRPTESLRILACTSIERGGGHRQPLALSRQTFEAVIDRWKLPRPLLYLLSTRRACFSSFEDKNGQNVGYMFQTTDKGWRPFGCASMYDSQANAAVIFLYGLVKDQFDLLCTELRESRNIIGLPTFIPICLLELKAEEVDKRLQFCHTELHQVKIQIGITRSNPMVNMSDFDKFDFVTISRMLTTLWATLAKCERTCEEHMMLLNDMGKYNAQFVLCLPDSQRANAKKRMKVLQKRIDFVRDWTQTFGPGTKYLSQRSQAYVQTVYSLMAQKDNALNNQLANASLRVSEASYRDSTAMKSLAEDSKHVLLATSRDSSMMCIIAILTLAFLPPTFTATLFSTEFFDFASPDGSHIISPRFWIYWVVTVSLTAVTSVLAGYFYRVRDKKLTSHFRKRGSELENMEKEMDRRD